MFSPGLSYEVEAMVGVRAGGEGGDGTRGEGCGRVKEREAAGEEAWAIDRDES